MTISAGCGVGCGAGVALAGTWIWENIRSCVFSSIADRDTGEQRRKAAPPDVDVSAKFMPGSFEVLVAEAKPTLRNERGFITLRNGQNIFFQTWAPTVDAKGKPVQVRGVVIFVHGFGDHCDLTTALKAKTICGDSEHGGLAGAAFDLPGHGRSDGPIGHIPDWQEFVDLAREVIVEHLKPRLLEQFPGREIFGLGESMGGGVLFSLLAREKSLFDGVVLVSPMIYVSRDLFPPWIIEQIFKYIMVPILPMWPAAPNKDLADFCNEDPEMRQFMNNAEAGNPEHCNIILGRAKPRLQTAYELAFVAGEWMKAQIPEYDTPTLLIHAGGDVVTDHRVSQALFEGMKHTDKEFLQPPKVWHADVFHVGPKYLGQAQENFEKVHTWLHDRCTYNMVTPSSPRK